MRTITLAKFELEQLVKQGQRSYEWKLRGASKWHGGAALMRLEHVCLKGSFNSVKTCMIYPDKQNMFHRFTPKCQISRLLYSRLPQINLLALDLQSVMKGKK